MENNFEKILNEFNIGFGKKKDNKDSGKEFIIKISFDLHKSKTSNVVHVIKAKNAEDATIEAKRRFEKEHGSKLNYRADVVKKASDDVFALHKANARSK